MLCVGGSGATETIQITVTNTVVPVCRFFAAAAPSMSLSNTGAPSEIDPRLSTPATGIVRIGYRCTSGTLPAFGVPPTATLSCAACTGNAVLGAALTWISDGAGRGMTDAGNRVFSLTAEVPPSAYRSAAPGDYTGNVTVTVSP